MASGSNISQFANKYALVTGAGKGIGRDVVKALAERGATVYAVSRTESDLKELQEECPSIRPIICDLKNWKATKEALKDLPAMHFLVNNAGVALNAPFLEQTEEQFDDSFAVNVKATLNVSQCVARRMIENKIAGSIVNISSSASLHALQNHTVYCATKCALDSLTRSMALELGPHGIRTNSVNPTVVFTKMGRENWSDPAKSSAMLSRIPLHRFVEVHEVVSVVLFLLNDESSMMNGAILPVDGGFQ